MHSLFLLVITVVFASQISGSTHSRVFDSVNLPEEWIPAGRPYPDTRIRLRIAMRMPDHEAFQRTLYAISTPGHEDYGRHLNHEEVRALVNPEKYSIDAVLSWLNASRIAEDEMENNGDWINFIVSVSDAEAMLATQFHFYTKKSDRTHAKQIRTLEYSLPDSVFPHVSMIHPTTRFGYAKGMIDTIFDVKPYDGINSLLTGTFPISYLDPLCDLTITPTCLRALYSIGDIQADAKVKSRLGIAGYLKQYAKYDALDLFMHAFAPYAASQNFTYDLINGGLSTQNDIIDDDTEANLDIQYAASLGFEQELVYYSTGGLGPLVSDLDQPYISNNEPYLEFLDHMLALGDSELPQTISTSYGENEQSVPQPFARTVCDKFGQLGLRGVSVLFSSGDSGPGSSCYTNDGKNTSRFLPSFPGACPYVTSVGGTYRVKPERAVSFSSGGFSDVFSRPSYQDAAVESYLRKLGSKWKGYYNPAGRGFPDVAAQAVNYLVKDSDGGIDYVGGTSASSPTFAAIISLLNNARLAQDQKPLGFLNPWLYSIGKGGLNDIIYGGSKGCYGKRQAPAIPYAGWNATKGWDPVTGLGTPNFTKLLELSSPGFEMMHISG